MDFGSMILGFIFIIQIRYHFQWQIIDEHEHLIDNHARIALCSKFFIIFRLEVIFVSITTVYLECSIISYKVITLYFV